MSLENYFKTLNLPPNASIEEIRSSYKKLAFKYHPDRNLGDSDSEKRFIEIVEAYEELKKHLDSIETVVAPRRKKPKKRKTQSYTANASKTDNKVKNRNLKYNVYISLEDILTGTNKVIRFLRLSNGQSEDIQLKVEIPKGAQPGQRLKVQGFGNIEGSLSGDLFVIVHHLPHPVFEVDGSNLLIDIPVIYPQMLLGGSIEVPTLNGFETLVLNQCEFGNIQQIIENQGLPMNEMGQRGQLIVNFFQDLPGSLTGEQEKNISRCIQDWPKSHRMRQYEEIVKKEHPE